MNNNGNSNGGFMTGLLLGALIGGGAVFLLGTKKGKKLLKTISEEGLEGISELGDFIENEEEAYEDDEEIAAEKPKTAKSIGIKREDKLDSQQTNSASALIQSDSGKSEEQSSVVNHARRLFKGVHKK